MVGEIMDFKDISGLMQLGIIAGIAIYALPKVFQLFGVSGGGTGTGQTGLQPYTATDVLEAGGTITQNKKEGLPWWTWISPFSMLAGGMNYLTNQDQTVITPPIENKPAATPLGYKKDTFVPIDAAVKTITKNYLKSTPSQQRVTEQIVNDLSKTVTVSGTSSLQPMTVERLKAVAKYGYGGR